MTQTTVEVHRLELSMKWKPEHVAAYLIETDDALILIDSGVSDEGNQDGEEELRAAFADAGYEVGDVDYLVVTHPHLDHVGQAPVVRAEAEPTVVAYETVPDALSLGGAEEKVRTNVREAGIHGPTVEDSVEGWIGSVRENRACLPPDSIDVLVGHGESFEVDGVRFETVHTPGHQADHACYAATVGGEKVVFSGDALASSFRSVIYHAGFGDAMWDAVGAYHDALDRLDERETDRVYPGHGGVFEDHHGAVEDARESLDRLVEDVYEKVTTLDEPTAVEVTLERIKPDQSIRYVIFENVGALGYLEAEGRVESYLDGDARRFRVSEA